MPKVIYMTGAPAAGKSSTTQLLVKSVPGLLVWEYGARLTEYCASKSSSVTDQKDLRAKSAGIVAPEDIEAVDRALLAFVEEHRSSNHVLIDSHPVTKEAYGYRITPFSFEQFAKLKPDEIWVLYASPEETRRRIEADASGRPMVNVEEARTHTMLQASVAATYGMSLRCPVYMFDTEAAREELIARLAQRLTRKLPTQDANQVHTDAARSDPPPSPARRHQIDLRKAINAVSDVVQNRPRPLRIFDQIHMKTGDMVLQSEMIADWADGKRLAFIGDGDAISVCVAYLQARGILNFGPSHITVFDFDERTVEAVTSFAERETITNLDARLYNVLDAMQPDQFYDCFYTNPPWGASNKGESVNVFVERGMDATGHAGEGVVVIADDDDLEWPKHVLANVQKFALQRGHYISRMQRKLHQYHLDDAPELKSCNLYLAALPGNGPPPPSSGIGDPQRLENFYGLSQRPTVRYVRARRRLDYGVAHEDEYELEFLEGSHE